MTTSQMDDVTDAATEITMEGCINAAGHHVIAMSPQFFAFSGQKAPEHVAIASVAYEKRIIEAVFDYIKALKKIGTQGPWYLCLGIANVKKSVLYVDTRFAFGGRVYEGDEIMPPPIEISADIALENPQAVARALQPIFDYIWREHGYPRSFNYAESGDWVGR